MVMKTLVKTLSWRVTNITTIKNHKKIVSSKQHPLLQLKKVQEWELDGLNYQTAKVLQLFPFQILLWKKIYQMPSLLHAKYSEESTQLHHQTHQIPPEEQILKSMMQLSTLGNTLWSQTRNIKLPNKKKENLTNLAMVKTQLLMTTTNKNLMPEIRQETWNISNFPEVILHPPSGLNFQTAVEHQVKYHSKKIMNLDTHH